MQTISNAVPQAAIPQASYAIMGGSSTFSIRFPEDLERDDLEVLARNLVFETPYGTSPPFKLFRTSRGQTVLTVKMHGRRPGVSRAGGSRQVFWVYQQAGVKRILAEGGVGNINHLLELRDLVLPTDYIDYSMRRDVDLGGQYLMVMRDPICPELHGSLYLAGSKVRRVFPRGVYAVTDGRHWESRAEVQAMRIAGADIVGQSICPEVYLSREIGACFAGVYMVVNYAEGVIKDWSHRDLSDIFYGEAKNIGNILVDALLEVSLDKKCECESLRKNTLLVHKPEED